MLRMQSQVAAGMAVDHVVCSLVLLFLDGVKRCCCFSCSLLALCNIVAKLLALVIHDKHCLRSWLAEACQILLFPV